MFSEKDIKQFKKLEIDKAKVELQIENFIKGFPSMPLIKPAIIGDGILKFSDEDIERYEEHFSNYVKGKSIVKFIPASGAASRMFKPLFEFLSSDGILTKGSAGRVFIEHINDFAFINDLQVVIENNGNQLSTLLKKSSYKEIISSLIESKGLNYGNLPKAILKFHKYPTKSRTAIEEHLVEGAVYCLEDNRIVNIHLTVSKEHKLILENIIKNIKTEYEKMFSVEYKISYSIQKYSTNTIAVDMSNQPFRDEKGGIIFRPGGHGALLENLNDIDADMIFIKNIDNVSHDNYKHVTYTYKKLLACVFVDLQSKIFNYLKILDKTKVLDKDLNEILIFLEKSLCIIPPKPILEYDKEESIAYAKQKLNRPFRIAGMVSSEGDTGGGPFWAKNSDGSISLQIVETAQINLNDSKQKDIFNSASHFNPNDLICGVKDYKGKKFDLKSFVDVNTGFIAKKSKFGRELKAQELPGLWNGSMSDWNTVFIDVPISTFTPVKMVNDLLSTEHKA